MKKTMYIITTVLFCLYIGGFGILHLLQPDREFSQTENRTLSLMPAFTWETLVDGTYTADLEEYLSDQFPMRDDWMGLKARYEYLLGKREFHDVYLCGDTLISKIKDTSRAEQNLSHIEKLLGLTDKPVYIGLIPSAAEIWSDKLPAGAPNFDQGAYLEKAKELSGIWVDIAGVLAEHSDEQIFYRTDHHWTSLGAYYGYAAFLEATGLPVPEMGEGKTVSTDFNGTLYSTSGVHWLDADTIEYYVFDDAITVENGTTGEIGSLYVESKLEEKDKYSSFLGGNNPLYIIRNPNATTEKKLLVVRDSYSDSLAPFLSQTYSEIHLIDLRYFRTSVAAYAEMSEVDEIFICYSVENFVKDADAVFIGK